MKKIFVIIDNKFMYNEFQKIISSKEDVSAHYFCSPESVQTFREQIDTNNIQPIILKEKVDFLIENFDLGISCHSKQIFPDKLVNLKLCINVHPGLNPHNRGWYPQVFSIMNGLPAGVTIHIMDNEIDHGNIIVQKEVEINSYDTSLDVYNRLLSMEIELLEKNIDNILSRNFEGLALNLNGNYNSIRDYHNICEIDLNKNVTMKEAINFLRAMSHPPYKNSYFIDQNGSKIYVSLVLEKE